jgi:hypothetical protein
MRLFDGENFVNPDNFVLKINAIKGGVGMSNMEPEYFPAGPQDKFFLIPATAGNRVLTRTAKCVFDNPPGFFR